MKNYIKSGFFTILSLMMMHVSAQDDALHCQTPPMGWNSWNWFGKKEINEQTVREVIDAIAGSGLRDAGYEYIIVDGGWRDTKLEPSGKLRPHPEKFPHGIKVLADYAHSKGLKFGLHTVPGTHDCGGDEVGGFGHEEVQIQQFVDWGIDFIKLDKCRYEGDWDEELLRDTYVKWHDLLAGCGRDITFSISAYTFRDWYPDICCMARTTGDIRARVSGGAVFQGKRGSVMSIAEENNESARFAGNGYWNDPDMLAMGDQGLSAGEQKAHFALWCIMSSPLMLGNDPRDMSSEEREILVNKEAIAVDQDPTEQGKRISSPGKTEIWVKRLGDGSRAVLLLNRDNEKSAKIDLAFDRIGLAGHVLVRNIFGQYNMGTYSTVFTGEVEPTSGLFLLIKEKD